MEALSRGLIQAENDNLIHGFKANKFCPSVSHLFFADDYLIFIKAKTRDARNLASLIDQFMYTNRDLGYGMASAQVWLLLKKLCVGDWRWEICAYLERQLDSKYA